MFRRIDTVIIRVRDLSRARSWYERNLGMATIHEDGAERLAVLATADGGSITLWELRPGEKLASDGVGTYPIFATDDAAEAQRSLTHGGVETDPLSEGEGVLFFAFHDPDGNRLEACQILA